jgi:hypothetical protein
MKIRTLLAASAALGLMVAASAANAAVTVSATEIDNLFGNSSAPSSPLLNGQVMLWDFDAIADSLVSYSGNVVQGPQTGGNTASPPYNGSQAGDTTKYASVQGGETSLFSADAGYALTSFSFYLGSPDAYNTLTFNFLGGGSQSFSGDDIWDGGANDDNGNRDWGYRIYYDFGGAKVTSISFSSTQNAFEFDGLAGNVAAIPEPGAWALMLLGFGSAGAMIRSQRRRQLVTA